MLRNNTSLCQHIFKLHRLTESGDVPSQNLFFANQYDRALHMHGYVFYVLKHVITDGIL